MDSNEDNSERRKSYLKLLLLTIRTWIWIGAFLLSRVLKHCEHKIAERKQIKTQEEIISHREEKEAGRVEHVVGR